jgi:hypothetical protein
MPRMGLEPTTKAFEREKTVHVSDHVAVATVTGLRIT